MIFLFINNIDFLIMIKDLKSFVISRILVIKRLVSSYEICN